MALWGAEVEAGRDYVHRFSQSRGRLRITQATLGSHKNLGWSSLEARVSHERRATLCTLHPVNKPMCHLELELEEDNSVTFSVNGQNLIYLSGYYIHPKAPTCTAERATLLKRTHQDMPDRSGSSKKSRRDDGKTCHHDSDHESSDAERIDGNKKNSATPPTFHKKNTGVKKPSNTSTCNKSRKKCNIDIQEISDDENETNLKAKEESELGMVTTIKGCLGAKVATVGNKVTVNYVGCLTNGKVFDQGKSYEFQLGAGNVIPGWDLGIKAMRVGEERILTIPPSQGYGDLKQDGIPPNSWLIYTIRLLGVEDRRRTTKGSTDA